MEIKQLHTGFNAVVALQSNVARSRSLIGSIGYLVNPESSSIGCSTEPVERIGTRRFDTDVTINGYIPVLMLGMQVNTWHVSLLTRIPLDEIYTMRN